MILESRKWRLILQGLALLVCTGLILGFSGPASYALQDDTPKPIPGPARLGHTPTPGRYAIPVTQAEIGRAVALHRDGKTSYWVPVRGYQGKDETLRLFVLTDDIHPTAPAGESTAYFYGRLVHFDDAPHAADADKQLSQAFADPIAPDTYVLIEGEAPKAYRPMVPLVGGLGLVWFLSLVSFTRAWRRVPRRR